MAGRRADVLDIREMVRRFQAGDGDRRIARDLSASRKTVSKYRACALAEGLTSGPLPEPNVLQARLAETFPAVPPPQTASKVGAHAARVVALRARGVERQAIYTRLCEEVGFTGSYASVYRFVRRLEPREPEACVRVETPAGEVAEVDFGRLSARSTDRAGRESVDVRDDARVQSALLRGVRLRPDGQHVAALSSPPVRVVRWGRAACRRR